MRTNHRLVPATLVTLLAAGCWESPTADRGTTSQELAGREGKIDADLDAPWRLEPVVLSSGVRDYGKVPIQITIDDAHLVDADGDYNRLDQFIAVEVRERDAPGPPVRYELADLAEVEVEDGPWPYTGTDDAEERARPGHRVCEPWREGTCADVATIGGTAKWYALAWHELQGDYQPGDDVVLEVTAFVAAELRDGNAGQLMIRGHLAVHLGESPLPRFGGNWMYGDLHYHSQFSDNEGESGHNVRGVVRAMGAMGLDFAFATDHASYSEQMVDLDAWWAIEPITGVRYPHLNIDFGDLRDLSPERYRFALERLHDPQTGANHVVNPGGMEPQTWRGRRVRPRLFLGSEVDAMPEMTSAQANGGLAFGNGLEHRVDQLCLDYDFYADQLELLMPGFDCDADLFSTPSSGNRVYSVDWQGTGLAVSREHVLHLPATPDPAAFVPSRTTTWGGASRRLPTVLSASGASGVTFLAHPVDNNTSDEAGPRLVPYSELQLLEAFGQRTMLGLQLWNENPRLRTEMGTGLAENTGAFEVSNHHAPGDCSYEDACLLEVTPVEDTADWTWAESLTETFGPTPDDFAVAGTDHDPFSRLFHGATTWDRMNAWGLMPGKTADLSWLAPGEPRRVFMAGGSDAHGDFNHRRAGYLVGTTETNSTAIGSPRNLVDLGDLGGLENTNPAGGQQAVTPPMIGNVDFDQTDVVGGLTSGRFSVTDGPAVRIVVDRNDNGVIDSVDTPMGGVVNLYGEDRIPLLVEWRSTPEFGPVDEIDLYVGAVKDSGYAVFAPTMHGVRGPDDRDDSLLPVGEPTHNKPPFPPNGKSYYTMRDHYLIDPTSYGNTLSVPAGPGQLRISVDYRGGAADRYQGMRKIYLDPRDYLTTANALSDGPSYFIRAFARTAPERWSDCLTSSDRLRLHKQGKCLVRLAYTNPIWALRQPWEWGDVCRIDRSRGIDGDGDGQPDGCDYCPDDARSCGPETAVRTWLERGGGLTGDGIDAVAHDAAGNAYVAGRFQGIAGFSAGGGSYTSAGGYDGFVARVNREGEIEAVKHIRGTGGVQIRGIAVAPDGTIAIAGSFDGQLVIGDGHTFAADGTDMFVAGLGLLDTGGQMYVRWARHFSGTGTSVLTSIAAGPDGQFYAAGYFANRLTLNGVTSGDTWSPKDPEAGYDCFIVRVDNREHNKGRVTRSRQIRGTGNCYADAIAVEDDLEVMVAGRFAGVQAYQPTTGAPWSRTAPTDHKGFIAKLTNGTAMSVAWSAELGSGTSGSNTCTNGDAQVRGLATFGTGVVAVGRLRRCAVLQLGATMLSLGTRNHDNWEGFAIQIMDNGQLGSEFVTEAIAGSVDFRAVDTMPGRFAVVGTSTALAVPIGEAWIPRFGTRVGILATFDEDGAATAAYPVGGSGSTEISSVSLHRDDFEDESIPDGEHLLYGGLFTAWTSSGTGDRVTSAGSTDGLFGQEPL